MVVGFDKSANKNVTQAVFKKFPSKSFCSKYFYTYALVNEKWLRFTQFYSKKEKNAYLTWKMCTFVDVSFSTSRCVGFWRLMGTPFCQLVTSVFLNLLLPRGTLGQLFQYLALPLDAKIGLYVNKSNNWRHPWYFISRHPSVSRYPGWESLCRVNNQAVFSSTPFYIKDVQLKHNT